MLKRTLILGLIVIIGAVAYVLYEQRDRDLSIAPDKTAGTKEFETKPSAIAVNISLPFERLTAEANRAAPKNYTDGGNGPDQCKHILGVKTCVGTKYNFNVTRGDISITPGANNTFHVSVPINVSGQGGFRGDGAKLLKLDKKNFHARVEAYSNIGLSIGQDWCPRPTISSNFRWIEGAKVEIIGGVWVGISGLIEDKLRGQLQELGNAVASQIKCDDVKQEAQKAWVSYSFPIDIPGNDDSLYVNVKPESFGFSGLQVSPGSANLALSLTAKVDVSSSPISNTTLALPPLQNIAFAGSSLNLAVPLHMTYVEIQEALSEEIVDKPISIDTPAGVATLTTRTLKIYPSGDALVVGALVDIDLPDRWLDVSGWVYLTTIPTPVSGGTSLRLENVSFSRALNNELWSVVSVVLEGTIRREIEKQGTIDLDASIQKAKEIVLSEVAKPHEGVTLNIGDPQIALGRISITAERLYVEGLFSSRADISLQAL